MSDFKISGGDAVAGLKNSISIFPWLFFLRNVICLIWLAGSLHGMSYCLHLPDYLSLFFVFFFVCRFHEPRLCLTKDPPTWKEMKIKIPFRSISRSQLRERAPVWRAVRLRQMQWHLESNVNYQRTMDIGWLAKMSPPYLLSAPIDHWSSFLQRGAMPSLTFWCLVGFYHLGWSPGCVASEKY